ncbi:phosphoribosyltransferase [Pseudomonas sp. LS44]|uniref:phosphoribosyltransferase n=1 Tax=Pseudomonas sp. LS44 TaxID=1357074 RepID=UPI00215B22B6|nr:phosphoribosyltransferase [Pseudomonas sp. LS44]UVE16420.1 phosphoribosyltransferase [Pseudomonas sp. LS44]
MPSTASYLFVFKDRRQAGRALAAALRPVWPENPLVLALPRGGVPLGYEIASAFDSPLDVLMVRKIGAPGHEEFAIGAVVDGDDPQWVCDDLVLAQLKLQPAWFEEQKQRQLHEIKRRRALYCGEQPPIPVRDRAVILVDDGIATGSTMRVALKALVRLGPRRLIVAVPVAPQEALDELRPLVDTLICLLTPEPFRAVGMHYEDFTQTTDEEVIELLGKARAAHPR